MSAAPTRDALRHIERWMRQQTPRSPGYWIVAAIGGLVVGGVIAVNEVPRIRAARAGLETVAHVLWVDCERQRFEYEFTTTSGTLRHGNAAVSVLGLACGDVRTGAPLPVRYTEGERASQVITDDPEHYARSRMLLIVGFMLAAFGGIAAVLLVFHQPATPPM